jgi:hypothetical protein
MRLAGIEPAEGSCQAVVRRRRHAGQPARGRASGRQPGEARAIGAGHRPGHLEGAPTVYVNLRKTRALGPGLPDPKGKVNGDVDVREIPNPERGVRVQSTGLQTGESVPWAIRSAMRVGP